MLATIASPTSNPPSPELLHWTAVRKSVPTADVTNLLRRWSEGDQNALNELVPLVYDELHRLARSYSARENPGHTLQGTALLNEAYMRLVRQDRIEWQNRAHFFGIAAQTMRRILVEHARRRHASKRGGGAPNIQLDENCASDLGLNIDVLLLDSALTELSALDPRRARVVELRFFGGLKEVEIAAVLGVSEPTVRRDWTIARAWLYRKMSPNKNESRSAGN